MVLPVVKILALRGNIGDTYSENFISGLKSTTSTLARGTSFKVKKSHPDLSSETSLTCKFFSEAIFVVSEILLNKSELISLMFDAVTVLHT